MNHNEAKIVLNSPACDWLTLTNWDYAKLSPIFKWAVQGQDARGSVKRMQYVGSQGEHCYLGSAEINDKIHNMLQISGSLADVAIHKWNLDCLDSNCSRIDLQITCPTNMNLFDLASRKKKGQRTVGYIESGGFATCYIGSFKSDKLIRIYHKDRGIVRFEVMYKGARAMPIMQDVVMHEYPFHQIASFLRYELTAVNDPVLSSAFEGALWEYDPVKPTTVHKGMTKTEKWLKEAVLPALTRYANSHDANEDLLYAFMVACGLKETDNGE